MLTRIYDLNMGKETKQAVIRSAGLLGVKSAAYMVTGSAVLLAGMIDSMVDVVASLIAHIIKPQSHHEEHQIALIQSFWIFAGGALVLLESLKHLDEPVEMASVGIGILLFTVFVDGTIVRSLSKSTNPVIVGLKEDIKADITNSVGGLVALSLIAIGAPMIVDKVIAIAISIVLIVKGIRMAHDNMIEATLDHDAEHTTEREGSFEPYV
jgi:divalent metal cation (Fe/Co/Zn/Cd) transporter